MSERRWIRILGDDCVYVGPCLVHTIIVNPDGATDYAKVYDGRDAVSGKQFTEVVVATIATKIVNLGQGVMFDKGIYIAATDVAVETTVVFTPL